MKLRMIGSVMLLAFVLVACTGGSGNDAVNRRRAERFGSTVTTGIATAIPTATATATALPVAGDVKAAVDAPDDSALTQLFSVALVVIFGIPAFWIISLRKVGQK